MYEMLTGNEPFHWLPSAQAVTLYRCRDRANVLNPYDAAVAEGKLDFVVEDGHLRKAAILAMNWCFKQNPADRPTTAQLMRFLDDAVNMRGVVESEEEMLKRYGRLSPDAAAAQVLWGT